MLSRIASALVLCGFLAGQPGGAAEYEFTSVVPKKKPAISATGVKGQKLNQVKIEADPSIELVNATDVTITACEVKSIKLSGCKKIRIYNCWFHDSKAPAVHLDGCEDVLVQGCRIERVASGLYAHQSTGVQFIGNYVENVIGPMPRGQMVQFDKVTGKQNVIRNNHAMNLLDRSRPEDMISIYESSGTAESPILIEENFLSGDPKAGSEGKSKSGSGIMLGDGKGGQYIVCRKNVLLAPGQVGIGVAGGGTITVSDNIIIGSKTDVSNVGLYVWNQSKQEGGEVVVRGNKVHWMNAQGAPNPYWNGGGFSKVTVDENAFQDDKLLEAKLESPLPAPLPPAPFGTKIQFPWPKAKAGG
jgi:hypothetical protein